MRLNLGRRALTATTALIFMPPAAFPESLSDLVRKSVVRGAQLADSADSVWQAVAGETVAPWQQRQSLGALSVPPPFLDATFAQELLALPLQVGANCAGCRVQDLEAKLPAARQEAVLLYANSGAGSTSAVDPGTARRVFPNELATAVNDGGAASVANTTIFNFEVYVRWRVVQSVLSDTREPAERRKLQACFIDRLGTAMLQGPLSSALAASGPASAAALASTPRSSRPLKQAVEGCGALLSLMQQKGLFASSSVQFSLGSGTDLFDEGDWQAGGSTSWQYVVSGSALVGASQLAQDRTAATGQGAGLYPGQLLSAPLAAYLSSAGVQSRVDEYFLDNRVGRPDPRTFSDPRYYSDVLLELVAIEQP